MDVARIGLAHGSLDDAIERYRLHPQRSRPSVGRTVGILVDLPGPKVRLGSFGDGPSSSTPAQRLDPGRPVSARRRTPPCSASTTRTC